MTMKVFTPGPDTAAWWRRLRDGELTVQVCCACGSVQRYPRSGCAACMHETLELRPASGGARLYSFTVVWRAPNEDLASHVPYLLALVELEEGPRLLTRLVDVATEAVHIGMPVRLMRCEVVSDAVALPLFGPAK